VRRRKLGPPARSWVYELTEWGCELEPVIIHLGRWGRRSPFRELDSHIGVDSLILALRGDFDPAAAGALTATYALQFDEDRFAIRVADGQLHATRGDAVRPDATIRTDAMTFAAMVARRHTVQELAQAGRLTVTGDMDAVERLVNALTRPQPAPVAST
jgi:alkyl sulfatase BDS1-like metallo-beta-lactamase superfamily hydrolase